MKDFLIRLFFWWHNLTAKKLKPIRSLPGDPFEALNQFFDGIWVLTIPRNTERQEFIRRQFQGLKFEFFTGVDGKTLGEDPRIALKEAEKESGRSMRINEFACSLSHLVMYQAMVDRGLDKVMIFEDDAVFLPAQGRWISYCLERLPADWDLLYFGYRDGELRGFALEFQEFFGKKKEEGRVVSRSVGRGLRTAAGHEFTHAYAVSLKGAKKLLEIGYPVRFTADGFLEYAVLQKIVTGYISIPKVFVQTENLKSTIHV